MEFDGRYRNCSIKGQELLMENDLGLVTVGIIRRLLECEHCFIIGFILFREVEFQFILLWRVICSSLKMFYKTNGLGSFVGAIFGKMTFFPADKTSAGFSSFGVFGRRRPLSEESVRFSGPAGSG